MTVTSGAHEIARTLLQTRDDLLVSIVIGCLLKGEDISATATFLEPFLMDENDTVRKRVLAYFVDKYSEAELEQLLERYMQRYASGESYYYDVVCWLDRILYTPLRLKEAFKHQLMAPILELTKLC